MTDLLSTPTTALTGVTALIGAILMVPVTLPLLRRVAADTPNARSSHVAVTPRGGGLAVIAAAAAAIVVAPVRWSLDGWFIASALMLLAVIGFVDDVFSLPTLPRLLGQLLVGAGLGLVVLARLDWPTALLLALSAGLVAGFVNAFNFMDGINGISAVTGSVTFAWFAWLGHVTDNLTLALCSLALLGAILGFGWWNVRGFIFLGDVGSYFLGGAIASCALFVWAGGTTWTLSFAPLVLYVADTTFTLVRRTMRGYPVGTAHRDHVYQRLTPPGIPHLRTALLIGALTSAVCLLTWLARPSTPHILAAWIGVSAFYLYSPNLLRRDESK